MLQPILFYTKVYRCSSCHTWYGRTPTFLGELDKGDYCERCGCTSFSVSNGRPIGKKSTDWEWVLEAWKANVEPFLDNEPEEDRDWLLSTVAFPSNTACSGLGQRLPHLGNPCICCGANGRLDGFCPNR